MITLLQYFIDFDLMSTIIYYIPNAKSDLRSFLWKIF